MLCPTHQCYLLRRGQAPPKSPKGRLATWRIDSVSEILPKAFYERCPPRNVYSKLSAYECFGERLTQASARERDHASRVLLLIVPLSREVS
jgi:hypothetical protein